MLRRAFTLIELLVVISIIALLIAILLVPMDTPGITVRQIPSVITSYSIHYTELYEPLYVQGSSPVEKAVFHLRGERGHAPFVRPRRHHVHVVDEHEARLLGPPHVAQDVRFPRGRAECS